MPVAGGSRTTLLVARRRHHVSPSVLYSASATRAVARRTWEGMPNEIVGGAPGGPVSRLDGCSTGQVAFGAGPEVDGGLAAWAGADCDERRMRVDFGDRSQVVAAGDFIYDLAAGGRYVAWLELVRAASRGEVQRTRLVVYDAIAGARAYEALVPPSIRLDVQADGTAVAATADVSDPSCPGREPRYRLLYWTAAEPFEHEVPVRACLDDVRIADDRIAYVEGSTLTLTNLSGTAKQAVAELDQFPRIASFDFDGARVAWTSLRCRDTILRVRDAADTSAPAAATRCPVRVGTPRLGRGGRIHVPIACPNGCRAARGEGLTVIAPSWLHAWRRTRGVTQYRPYRAFNLRRGGRTVLELAATRRQRALIRRKGRVSVRLKVLGQNVYMPRIARTLRAR